MFKVRRLAQNPILHPDLDPSLGTNLNGPSLIRVPDWVPCPLGRYYLYFAHHSGEFIRLAYADDLQGPWRIHAPGTLRLEQTCCQGHIASPDVHVDHERRELLMYFHGPTTEGQRGFMAVSRDGLAFEASDQVMGLFYLRAFTHRGGHYGIARAMGREGGGALVRSPDGRSPYEVGAFCIPRQRHAAVLVRQDTLYVFFSRIGDCPERLLVCTFTMKGPWRSWQAGEPHELLVPEESYEGVHLPPVPSQFGAVLSPVRELRDPAIFEEDGRVFLLYSCAGESAIGMAELTD